MTHPSARRIRLSPLPRGHPAVGQRAHATQSGGVHETVLRGAAAAIRCSALWPHALLAQDWRVIRQRQHKEDTPEPAFPQRVGVGVGFCRCQSHVATEAVTTAGAMLLIASYSSCRDRSSCFGIASHVPSNTHAAPSAMPVIAHPLLEETALGVITDHLDREVSDIATRQTFEKRLLHQRGHLVRVEQTHTQMPQALRLSARTAQSRAASGRGWGAR